MDSIKNKKDERSYQFGKLLALLKLIEEAASFSDTKIDLENSDNKESRDKRPTHASRYWNVYTKRPSKTYMTIMSNLRPYIQKLEKSNKSGLLAYYNKKIGEIMISLGADFNNEPLNEKYLLGYYEQYYSNLIKNNDSE